MTEEKAKPVVGISCGDINGIGIEVIIKSFTDQRMLDFCIPVVFGSNKHFNYYRKTIPQSSFNYNIIRDFQKLHNKQLNIMNIWEEDNPVNPGMLNETGGRCALLSLEKAVESIKENNIDILVTAPIHKKNIQSENFKHTGHTPYFKAAFGVDEVLMMMVSENMRVALVTEHVAVQDISRYITRKNIVSKLKVLNNSLKVDFGIDRPKVAVLGLNPHAGDEGTIGREDEMEIKSAIRDMSGQMIISGPFSADAFFARSQYQFFDAVLCMYHDQGLIPFKSLSIGEGVNFTAGLPFVRTSPDHGTAFDIAGQNKAHHESFLEAVFRGIEIYKKRLLYDEMRENPIKKNLAKNPNLLKDE